MPDRDLSMSGVERHRADRAALWLHPHLADDAALMVALSQSTRTSLPKTRRDRFSFERWPNGWAFSGRRCLGVGFCVVAAGIQHGYRVAIGNPDHATGERFSLNRTRQKEEER